MAPTFGYTQVSLTANCERADLRIQNLFSPSVAQKNKLSNGIWSIAWFFVTRELSAWRVWKNDIFNEKFLKLATDLVPLDSQIFPLSRCIVCFLLSLPALSRSSKEEVTFVTLSTGARGALQCSFPKKFFMSRDSYFGNIRNWLVDN